MTLALDPDSVTAGPLGFLIVLLMLLATVFLIRNMSSRLTRLPREFPPSDHDEPPTGPEEDRRHP